MPLVARLAARSAGSSLQASTRAPSVGRSNPSSDGVKELTTEPARAGSAAVAEVARDGQSQVREVGAELVGAPRSWMEAQEGVAGARAQDVVLGHRLAAAGDHRHPLPIARVAADGRLDPALRRRRGPADQGQVALVHRRGHRTGS